MFPKGKSKNNKNKIDVEKYKFIVTEVSSESGYIIVKPDDYERQVYINFIY